MGFAPEGKAWVNVGSGLKHEILPGAKFYVGLG